MEQQLSFKLLAKNKCLYWNLMQNSRRWSFARAFSHLHSAIPPYTKSTDLSLCAAKGACVVPMWNAEPRAVRPASRQEIRPKKSPSECCFMLSCSGEFFLNSMGNSTEGNKKRFLHTWGEKRESSFEHSEMEETRHEIVTNSLKFSFWPDLLFLIF